MHRRTWLRILWSLGLIGALFLMPLACFQRRLQYFPDTSQVLIPGGNRYGALEDVTLEAEDGVQLRAWYWPASRPATLVLFHGNAGHRGHRLGWLESFHDLGLGLFALDYRGYGGSEGSPTEDGLYLDAEASVRWLRDRGAGPLVYFGESLGCGVAVHTAVRHPPAALILQAGFSSAVDAARRIYPFLPVSLLMSDRYESIEKIQQVRCPVLSIHGARDAIIPVALGRALFDAAPGPKDWFEVSGAGHNDLPWVGGLRYLERIDAFVRKHVEEE